MTPERFDQVVKMMQDHCWKTLCGKGEEYGKNTDRLHNFKRASEKRKEFFPTPEVALLGMDLKHDVSIDDIIRDVIAGKLPTMDILVEKFGDHINYIYLLMALIVERMDNVAKLLESDDDNVRDAANVVIPGGVKIPAPVGIRSDVIEKAVEEANKKIWKDRYKGPQPPYI